MPFIFERFAVVVAYHAEFPDDTTGTEQELATFDEALSERYGKFLSNTLAKHGLPDTRETRSMAVLLAKLSSGSAKSQLENACQYYSSTRPVLPIGDVASAGVSDGAVTESMMRTGSSRRGKRRGRTGKKRGTRRTSTARRKPS